MIDERMEEQASLYVLGALDGDELRAFESTLARDAELRQLVAALRAASDAVAGSAPLVSPPAGLKQKILAEIDRREKIVPLPAPQAKRTSGVSWFPWAMAAGFMIICGLLATQKNASEARSQAEKAALQVTIAKLETATNDLHQTVAELMKQNELMSVRVAVLESLVPESKAVAVTLWDEEKQSGVLVAQKLPALPSDKDYQLWVIDPNEKAPIDAGVFQVDANGTMHAKFTAKSAVKTAKTFAVTVEDKGGVPSPKGRMVLAGS
jgi:anti-sigma-K factor RskA